MEALALGRPVISTYIAGIPELVEPGVNGWLVPAGAVEPLVDAMAEVLTADPPSLNGWVVLVPHWSPNSTIFVLRPRSSQTCSQIREPRRADSILASQSTASSVATVAAVQPFLYRWAFRLDSSCTPFGTDTEHE